MFAQTKHKLKNFLYKTGLKEPSLYTPQEEVIAELHRRRALITDDSKLLEIIKPTPSIQRLIDEPHLVLFRQVATPLHETLRVIEIAKELGLKLCIVEYYKDKMVGAQNHYKHGLAMLPIYESVDRRGNDIFHRRTVADINLNSGRQIAESVTLKGESLVEFHHKLFQYITGVDINGVSVDISDWLSQFDSSPNDYYEAFFTLFIKHSVQAEVFLVGNSDRGSFTTRVIEPAFEKVKKRNVFGPLILNYQPPNEQDRIYWDCYPSETDDFLIEKGYIEK